jgi:hypothetical protein
VHGVSTLICVSRATISLVGLGAVLLVGTGLTASTVKAGLDPRPMVVVFFVAAVGLIPLVLDF